MIRSGQDRKRHHLGITEYDSDKFCLLKFKRMAWRASQFGKELSVGPIKSKGYSLVCAAAASSLLLLSNIYTYVFKPV